MHCKKIMELKKIYLKKFKDIQKKFKRSLSFGDYFTDRYERAKLQNFGKGTSVYDNVLIIGNVKVGKNTWIGPNCILDGSGNLEIGDNCSISAGVQIYTHNSMQKTITLGSEKIKKKKTVIGNNVYIGPNSVLTMGLKIEDRAVIGALSYVDKNIKKGSKFFIKKR